MVGGAGSPRRQRSRSRSPAGRGGAAASRWTRNDDEDADDGGGGGRARAAGGASARPPSGSSRGAAYGAAAAHPAPGGEGGGGAGGAGGGGGGRRRGRWDDAEAAPPPAALPAPPPAPPPPPPPPIHKPDFAGLSGRLAAEANTVNGVVLKFAPPAEARACKDPRWRVYVFKDGGGGTTAAAAAQRQKRRNQQEPVGDPIPLDRYPYYLFGKERRVADVPTDHPSCSRQHAVVCFREIERLPEGGLLPSGERAPGGGAAAAAAAALAASRRTLPYLVDLETANGTFLNGERVDPGRFYELFDGDVVKFGASTREYVFIAERQGGASARP